MIIDSDFVSGVNTVFAAIFDQVTAEVTQLWSQIAMTLDTADKKDAKLSWLGAPPRMRPFRGTLDEADVYPHNYTITNTPRGVMIGIDFDEFRYNSLDSVAVVIAQLAEQAASYYDEIVFGQLSSGFTGLSFDGDTFYSASHNYGASATHDNLDTADLATDATVYNTAWATINTAQDDHGRPLGAIPDVLVFHPTARKVPMQLLSAEVISQTSNVFAGEVKPLSAPWLTLPAEWHLLATGRTVKPIVLSIDLPAMFVAQDNPNSDSAFAQRKLRYKVECVIGSGFGDPRYAYGSDGSA